MLLCMYSTISTSTGSLFCLTVFKKSSNFLFNVRVVIVVYKVNIFVTKSRGTVLSNPA